MIIHPKLVQENNVLDLGPLQRKYSKKCMHLKGVLYAFDKSLIHLFSSLKRKTKHVGKRTKRNLAGNRPVRKMELERSVQL